MLRSIAAVAVLAVGLGACTTTTTTTSGSSQLDLTVVNSTGYPIYYLYVSSSSSGYWGNDVLGSSILRSGQSATVWVNVGSNCNYDIRVIDDVGTVNEFYGFNVCQNDIINLY